MKTEIEQLIDRLADKSLTFGCLIWSETNEYNAGFYWEDRGIHPLVKTSEKQGVFYFAHFSLDVDHGESKTHYKVLGHPILIGDVLEKMASLGNEQLHQNFSILTRLWQPLGFTKSLQEIFAECEWQRVTNTNHEKACVVAEDPKYAVCNCKSTKTERDFPKQKAHRELFEFLLQLGL